MVSRDSFNIFLISSLALHIAVVSYLMVRSGGHLFSSSSEIAIKNAIRVNMIGLPQLQKKISQSVSKKKSQKKISKKRSTKKIAKKNKIDKRRKKKIMKEAQAQAIDKLGALESFEQIKQNLEPPKYIGQTLSKGHSPTGDVVNFFLVFQYFTSVRSHINVYWSLPQELADKSYRAQIHANINEDGVVLSRRIIQSSGNEDFDARVLETIDRASPFPKPPKEVQRVLSEGVVFKFPK